MTRLTILLGAGGVGKTTLAAGLALAHAHAGARAGLLGIDPAQRLRTALGLDDVPERGVVLPIAGPGALEVALLDPSASLRRWVTEACPDEARRARVFADPFFIALADRLAGLTDAIGCARAAEWVERDPRLDELVLDTAPGVAGIDLLARPDKLRAFFDGRLLRWLIRLARVGRTSRVLSGITELSGTEAIRDLGDLLATLDATVPALIARLERVRRWLADPRTAFVAVCGGRADTVATTRALAAAMRQLDLAPSLVVLNRALPDAIAKASLAQPATAEARAFVRYVANRVRAERRVWETLVVEAPRALAIAEGDGLDSAHRLEHLIALAEPLRARLATRS